MHKQANRFKYAYTAVHCAFMFKSFCLLESSVTDNIIKMHAVQSRGLKFGYVLIL